MSAEAPTNAPLLLPFDSVEPRFGDGVRFLGLGASVLGKVETGARAMIAGGAAIRGDGHFVRIGGDFSSARRAPSTSPKTSIQRSSATA